MTQENQYEGRNEDQEMGAGGYGTPTAEQELGGSRDSQSVDTNAPQADSEGNPIPRDPDASLGGDADLPSSSAEIDESNDDSRGSDPFSSESEQEATGLPDGSGNDLPQEETPTDDDRESFDAG